jgi:hypothetical protein
VSVSEGGVISAVLASRRRRQAVVDLVEPSREQLTQTGRRRRDLALRDLGDEGSERTLRLSFGADVRAAELSRSTARSVAR